MIVLMGGTRKFSRQSGHDCQLIMVFSFLCAPEVKTETFANFRLLRRNCVHLKQEEKHRLFIARQWQKVKWVFNFSEFECVVWTPVRNNNKYSQIYCGPNIRVKFTPLHDYIMLSFHRCVHAREQGCVLFLHEYLFQHVSGFRLEHYKQQGNAGTSQDYG